jgi:hypothetical protein
MIEVLFSAAMLWRMINLFDLRGVYPFGEISFAYASVVSVRMTLQILTGGQIVGLIVAIFSVAAIASLLALILPIWPVHRQMLAEKISALDRLDQELHTLTHGLFGARDTADVSRSAAQVMAIGAMRDRVAARWTWPVPDSITAVQVIALSSAPTLLTTAKTYLLPALGLS